MSPSPPPPALLGSNASSSRSPRRRENPEPLQIPANCTHLTQSLMHPPFDGSDGPLRHRPACARIAGSWRRRSPATMPYFPLCSSICCLALPDSPP
jgi:hypothetical protein